MNSAFEGTEMSEQGEQLIDLLVSVFAFSLGEQGFGPTADEISTHKKSLRYSIFPPREAT